MFRKMTCLLAAIVLVWSGPSERSLAAEAACVANQSGVPPERLAALAKGFNLSGWFEGDGSPPPDMAVLASLRRRGMTHVRLPVQGELVIAELSDDARARETLRRLDEALSRLNAAGFTVSVDLHFGGTFSRHYKSDPAAAERQLLAAWSGLSRIIASHPPGGVLAELLNEPEIDPDQWQSVVTRLAAYVRERLPRTTLIIGPTHWQRADALPGLIPLDDPNVVYAIHFYDPMVFTHQGHWDETDPLSKIRGLPFPFSSDDPEVVRLKGALSGSGEERALHELDKALGEGGSPAQIARALAPAERWQAQYHRPIIVNEFGVFKDASPPQSRQRWLGAVIKAAESRCWGWTHWEYAAGFGFLNADGRPDPATMRTFFDRRDR